MPSYTPEQIAYFKDVVFRRRAAGENLQTICADPDWPSRPTLRKWARADPEFALRIESGRSVHFARPRFPFDPAAAERFLLQVRLGYPVTDLIRRPDMPQRRELTAWQRQDPAFAAAFAEAKATMDASRRRYGGTARGYRRSRMRFDWDVADRIVLAVTRGATLPDIVRRREFPTRLGLKRWRKLEPVFDATLKRALKAGHRARGRKRVDANCPPELMDRIAARIVDGASLHSLSKEPDMPGPYALYKWIRDRPGFAAAVADACDFRTQLLTDRAFDLLMQHGEAAIPQVAAINKRLGQMRPYPGERRKYAASPPRRSPRGRG